MAIGYSLVASNTVATDTDTVTTGSFTPVNRALLVAIAPGFVVGTPSAGLAISDSASLTWTNHVARVDFASGGSTFPTVVSIWTAPVVTGTSMTVTVDYNHGSSDANGRQSVYVIQVTGHNTTTPVAQSLNGGIAGAFEATRTDDFGSAPASSSLVLACAAADDNTPNDDTNIDIGSGWTLVAAQHSGSPYNVSKVQARTGSTSTTVRWEGIEADFSHSVGAIEIAAASGLTFTYDASENNSTDTSPDNEAVGLTLSSGTSATGMDRLVILGGIVSNSGTPNGDFDTVSIDGVSATRVGTVLRGANSSSNLNAFLTAYRAAGTANSGFSVTAACNLPSGGDIYNLAVACYKLSSDAVLVDFDSDTETLGVGEPALPFEGSLSIDTVANGAVIGAMLGFDHPSPTTAWTALSEDFDTSQAFTQDNFSCASAATTTAEARAIGVATPFNSGTDSALFAAFSFGPEGGSPDVSVDATGNSMTASVGDVTVTIPATSVTVNIDGLSLMAFAGRAVWPGDSERQREGQMMEMGRWMGH